MGAAAKLQLTIPMGSYSIEAPAVFAAQELFDFEHFGNRHRQYLREARLTARGDDHIEFLFGQKLFGLGLPPQRIRATLHPPHDVELKIIEGILSGTRVTARVRPNGSSSDIEETQIMELPDHALTRAVFPLLRALAPALGKLLRWRADLLKEQDAPAFRRMARALEDDDFRWNGLLLRFPRGGARARLDRLDAAGFVRGCADCGRFDLGYTRDGVIRCATCDYVHDHTGEGHELRKTGAEYSCRCVDESRG